MSIFNSDLKKSKWPTWILAAGIFGIGNYVISFLTLAPPDKGDTVYFWLVQFYGTFYLPTVILFPVSMVVVLIWLYKFIGNLWIQKAILISGVVISVLCIFFTVLSTIFFPMSIIVGRVEQNGLVYYLIKYYDDLAYDYAFCDTDKTGFSGKCTYFAFQDTEATDPQFYVDHSTNLLTVKFENTDYVWRISLNPTRIFNELNPEK